MKPDDPIQDEPYDVAMRCQIALAVSLIDDSASGRRAAESLVQIAEMYQHSDAKGRADVADTLYVIFEKIFARSLKSAAALYGPDHAVTVYCDAMLRCARKIPIEDIIFVLTEQRYPKSPFSEN